MLPCVYSLVGHRWHQNAVSYKKVAHKALQPSVSVMFLPRFDVLNCDLLLNRCTATWNLLDKSYKILFVIIKAFIELIIFPFWQTNVKRHDLTSIDTKWSKSIYVSVLDHNRKPIKTRVELSFFFNSYWSTCMNVIRGCHVAVAVARKQACTLISAMPVQRSPSCAIRTTRKWFLCSSMIRT